MSNDIEYDYRQQEFEKAVRPLMNFLGKEWHPHTHVVVTCNTAELSEGTHCFNTDEYVRD